MISRRVVLLSLGVLTAFALLGIFVAGRIDEVRRAGDAVAWGWFWAALACAMLSHALGGFALSATLAALGHPLGGPAVWGISLVSTTANYVVSAGGVTGFALKAHLLHKRNVPIATTVTATAVTSAILYAVLALILGQGFLTLVLRLHGERILIMESGFGLIFLILIAAASLAVFFNHRVRNRLVRRIFRWTNRAAYSLSQREIPPEDFSLFEHQLAQGLVRIRAGKGRLTAVVAFIGLDWGFAMASLWFCFRAVSLSLPVGYLSAAFTIGQAATLIPFLPGGLGAAEGSIAALMNSLDIDVGAALVAAMLFRLSYYVVPSLLSILVLWGLKVSEPAVLEDAKILERDLGRR